MVATDDDNGLGAELAAEVPPPEDALVIPFYQRPVWKRTFIGALLIGLWLAIGVFFSSSYFRF